MFRVVLIGALLWFAGGLPQSARAEDGATTAEAALKAIDGLPRMERCIAAWDVMWPLAKKGDAAARLYLAVSVMPMMHMDMLVPPGRTGDFVSRFRDVQIMFMYGMSAAEKIFPAEDDMDGFKFISESLHDYEVDRCVSERRYDECAAIAVERKRIPAFDDYAAEIDALVAQGFKASCVLDGATEERRKQLENKGP